MLDSDAHIGAPADSPESSTPAPRRRRRSASRPAGPPKAIEPTPAPAEIAPTPEPESVEAEWSEVPVDAPVVESAPEPVAEEVDARADQMTEQHRMQAAMNSEARAELAQLRESKPLIARQLGEWHEDDGPVAWWAWCGHEWAGEPAWIGTPNSSDWPGYHTHWTPHPEQPDAHGIGEKTP